ncbi:MAG: hypothetical protein IJ466_08615 [Clostridia bacterium]|nr:hypothetical protein [Clostridia bacterium]
MNIRKILCLCLALVLCCAGAFAESDLQAQLDAANAQIAELQAQVEKYYPFYAAQVVATYGEDGVVWLADLQAEYDAQAAQYSSYGIDLEGMGLADLLKQDLVATAVETGVLKAKAAELGLDQMGEEEIAAMEEEALITMESYVEYYLSYYYPDAAEITDEMRAEAEAYWASTGMDYETILASMKEELALAALYDMVTKDVAITEEDVQAKYETMVADDQSYYTDSPAAFGSDYASGAAAYIPEGYRAVKQVLVGFNDEQSALYSQLQTQLDTLNAEKEAIENPVEGEEAAETRAIEDVNADIAACAAQIEALYAQLTPTVEEVVAAFEAGASIEELIEKYNTDPGMMNEPYASMGYAVSADSNNYDAAFQQAAMSIAEIGQISEPAYGSYGAYIVYYLKDIAPGAVALEDIRETVESSALSDKLEETYYAQVDAWVAEANVEYFYENFGITAA